jgi:AraC-like DNA-binding protein
VTTDSGYRKVTSLACLFKKMYGMSMRQYRNAHRKRN